MPKDLQDSKKAFVNERAGVTHTNYCLIHDLAAPIYKFLKSHRILKYRRRQENPFLLEENKFLFEKPKEVNFYCGKLITLIVRICWLVFMSGFFY